MTVRGKRAFMYKVLPYNLYLKILYKWTHHGTLSFDHPKRFTEKLFLLKKYYRDRMEKQIQECYDKYTVRQYVKCRVGEQYLTELFGYYRDADEIDFRQLPEDYIMKITQSSGMNIIHTRDSQRPTAEIRQTMSQWLNTANDLKQIQFSHREEAFYFNGKAGIVCEELLRKEDGGIPEDIRIFCFHGKAKFFSMDFDSMDDTYRKTHSYYKNTYDMNQKLIPVDMGLKRNESIKLPDLKNYNEMIEVAEKLAEPFPFVRVDLYNIDGRIVFGELTWIPQGAGLPITPIKFDYQFGEYLDMSKLK